MTSVTMLLFGALVASVTAATPSPASPSDPSKCTATVVTTVGGPPPPADLELTRTVTIFTETETTTQLTDCGGCGAIKTETLFADYDFPEESPILKTVTATEPTRVTKVQCATSPVAAPSAPTATLGHPDTKREATGCTSLFFVAPQWTHGPTKTVWTTTMTQTATVDCGSCDHLQSTILNFGPGPVIIFNATTTLAEPTWETVHECSRKTDQSGLGSPIPPVAEKGTEVAQATTTGPTTGKSQVGSSPTTLVTLWRST